MIGMSDGDCFRKLAEDVCAKVCVLCLRGGSGGGIWCVGRKAEAMGYIVHPESGTCEGMCVYALCSHQFAQCIAVCVGTVRSDLLCVDTANCNQNSQVSIYLM